MTTVLRDPFTDFTAWTGASGASIIAGGRTATGAQIINGGQADFNLAVADQSDWVTMGAAYKTPDLGSVHFIYALRSDSASTPHVTLIVNTNGSVSAMRGTTGGTLIGSASAAGVLVANTWAFVEMQVKLHDTTGAVTVRVNGTDVLTLTNVDTKNAGTKTVFDVVRIAGVNATSFYDDLYVKTGSGETFQGDVAIGTEGRLVRHTERVAFSEPMPKDWYRNIRHSVRVAVLGGTTTARIGSMSAGVLRESVGGNAKIGGVSARVLRERVTPGAKAKVWSGSAFVDAPIATWSGSAFQYASGVKTWTGSAFAVPWTPASVSALTLWLDAADATQFVFSTGSNVNQWRDKATAGHHFGEISAQPARTGTQNGKSTVVFAGAQRLTCSSWAMTKPVTIFVVAKNTSAAATQRNVITFYIHGSVMTLTDGRIDIRNNQDLAVQTQWGTTLFHQVTGVFNGTTSKIQADGGTENVGTAGTTGLNAGGLAVVGAYADASQEYWVGEIAEILVYEKEVTGSERTTVEAYLKTKWGTP